MENVKLQEQSNRAQWLLEEAGERGYLTTAQIVAAFPEVEDGLDQLEDLLATLYDEGVKIFDSEEEAEESEAQVEAEQDGKENQSDAQDLSGIPVDDAVGLYFGEMSREPLLTPEEEVQLAKRLEQGREARRQMDLNGHNLGERARLECLIARGKQARERLVKANTRLVVSVAKRYRGLGLPFLDLIQAGNLGLIRAADRFDYRRGYKFGTYATWWIRQAVTRSLSQHGRTIRVPVHMGDRIRKLIRTAQRVEQDLGHQPIPEEIAEEAGLDADEVRWMLRVSSRPMSLEKPVGDEENASELGDFIEDENEPSPSQRVERVQLREELERMLSALPAREARILRLRFGLEGDRTYTLQEIGEKLGVSRERVRQIQKQALGRLRHPRHRRKLQDYLR
jgi:RNA polymerase primary sigma factor